MSRYTVLWDKAVEDAFTRAWVACDKRSRQTLTEVANWIDTHLASNPEAHGIPRTDLSARIVVVPLKKGTARVAVTFQVLPDDCQVRIVRIVFR